MFFLITLNKTVHAQGDGPRSYSLSPKDIFGLNQKWTHSTQNVVPAGSIFLIDSDITFDAFPTTLFYNFSINNTFAQIQLMINPGAANGSITTSQGDLIKNLDNSGFSDGFAALRIGLLGAPALSVLEFKEHIPSLSVFGYFRLFYPGSYDTDRLLNLGTNRFTFEFGTQVSFPLAKNARFPVWLESYPYFQFYTNNSNPSIIVMGEKVTQKPLFGIENHLSHNFTNRFWMSIDLHYKIGGDVSVDGLDQENQIHALGGGFTVGYSVFSFLKANLGYGTILFGDKGIQSNMLRLSLVLLHSKSKNLK